jgi:hypothetical protein
MKKLVFFLLISFNLLYGVGQERKDSVYIFCYFKGNGEDGLHYAYSKDGLKYTSLNNDKSFLTPTVAKDKLMRDPCIIRGTDGEFHMVWTVSWNDKGIGYAHSSNLIHWSEQQFLPVMESFDSTRNTWAPEITYEPFSKKYMIYWASTIAGKFPNTVSSESKYNHRMYYTITKDFKKFSRTKLLYDQHFNVIDATIKVLNKDYFLMFLKDETLLPQPEKNIRIARSNKLTKDYSPASPAITGKYWAEGPTVEKIGDKWVVLFDKYRDHTYGAVESNDLINWFDISDKISMPKGLRHGTIFMLSTKEFETFFGK